MPQHRRKELTVLSDYGPTNSPASATTLENSVVYVSELELLVIWLDL